ncbi:LysR family transcriptional regulator substrate-binding protein [Galbitalea sp. SE-J8]|uniref:LysR family transcriptional regulator substrate-binding protein n=1 Tax=Galbitalea sp. SE-J8 TaxID=3054952 RepID=UPI00259CA9E7|nr:LysR family transcriptional regulator substrate-binding protein [Galbitalea sp. SE-J8]MDM4762647.1 LysR family transcriptional regulator substrate-binding protein [Galbitalea sp. SE-J8]
MSAPLVVAFVPGVTPDKWERVWRERMRRHPLELRALEQPAALDALRDGSAHLAFLRDVGRDDEFHAIPLYREQPVVVAPKDSPVAAFDELVLADLAGEPLVEGYEPAMTLELVAAGTGLAVLPMSLARLHARKDVVARPVADAADTGIALVWPVERAHELADAFIGVVRGRTPNSSR